MPSRGLSSDAHLSILFDALRIQREFGLKDLEQRKTKALSGLKTHFTVLRFKIPKSLMNATMGELFDKGILNDNGDASFLETISGLEGTPNALQSTIRECNFLKPTPRFEDISAISVGSKDEVKRKKATARNKVTSTTKNSPYKLLTASRFNNKRKASVLSPCKPYQLPVAQVKLENLNYETLFSELSSIRKESILRLTESKENYKEAIKSHFDELRKNSATIEKVYNAYRDADDMETFFKNYKLAIEVPIQPINQSIISKS